jgi:TonB-linked SusC/RagA family outer membrane protein
MKQKLLFVLTLFFLSIGQLLAQNREITGRVTDPETGEGIPGVNVSVKGTSAGTVTDADGRYKISITNGNTLVFQAVGLEAQEVLVVAQAILDIQMVASDTALDEVVITGYGETIRKEITGSISTVSSKDISKLPSSNLQTALQGQTSGVFVTSTSGTPGGSMSVRVRGLGSINGNNAPLYIVDGVPVIANNLTQNAFGGQTQSALNSLNPQDIESMQILKDPSVTAIYGARAANGVILVTTKKGKAGKPQFNVNYFSGWSEASNRYDMASSQLYVTTRTAAGGTLPTAVTQWDGVTNVDLQDVVFKTARTHDAQLSISGGNDNTNYYLSGSYRNEEAIFIGGGIERFTARVNVDQKLSEKLKVSARLSLSNELNQRIENDNNIYGMVSIALLTPSTIPLRDPETGEFNDLLPGFGSNPVREAERTRNRINTTKIVGNFNLNYEILKGLNFVTDFSYDYNNVTEDINNPANTAQGRPDGSGLFASRVLGTWNLEPRFSYRNTFAENHSITAVLGTTFLEQRDVTNFVQGTGFARPDLTYLTSAANITGGSSNKVQYSFNSLFSRISYSFKEKYVFNVAIRADGSSRFGDNKKFGIFYSLGAAWNFADEAFMENFSWLSGGKLRVGYGIVGNDGIPNFQYLGTFGAGNYNGQSTYTRGNIANPDLQWEQTAGFDVALELSFLKDRISFSAGFFDKNTTKLLINRTIPSTTGFNAVQTNIGSVNNRGFEFELGGTVLEMGDFRWNLRTNLTLIKNKVTDIPDDVIIQAGFANQVVEGQPIGTFWGLNWLGVNPATGDSEFEDVNGDGVVTSDDQKVIGNAFAEVYGGFTNTFTYKGLTLDVLFQYVGGVDLYNNSMQFMMNPASNFQDHDDLKYAWKNPGDITFVPRIGAPNTDFSNDNSRWIDNGNYLRLRNVTLSYDLPVSLVKKVKLRNLRVYVTGSNLINFTKYEGLDPEVNTFGNNDLATGTEFLTAPQPRSFILGINVGF